jgi:hypothetical protein
MLLEGAGEAGSIEELQGICVVLGSRAGDDLFKSDRKLIRIERSSLSHFRTGHRDFVPRFHSKLAKVPEEDV